ncbi:MAG: lamin tail domain-containing protein, partial [Phycisphaerae bacterium]|nr:lamin tail domain-containing protein [Phycisphaerae bacterium]
MFEEVKKIGWLVPLLCVIFGLCARGDIQPVSDIVVSVQAGNPEHIWLAAVQIKDLEISTDRLVNGHSTGMATAAVPLYNEITNADNMDLNLFAARNNEDPPEWRITDLGGHALYWDTNGDQPDFLLFETNGNDDIQVQAILPDGSLGQEVAISKSMWGDTGLRITASTHTNQKIKGMAWSLTDLLDAQGLPLTGFQAIAGIQITSPGLDPACFCAVQGAMANQLPQVEAGESIDLLVPDNAALLSGTVTDDGQGDPNGYLFYQWAWKEGPGEVIFEPNCFVLSPSVILLGGPGIYVLELTATDGTLESSDQVTLYLQSTDIMGRIVLNELLATDDPDSKDTEDWIELYNPTDLPVDIAGYFLTDDPDDPLRWRVPGGDRDLTTISPGGFLRIWADGGFAPGLHASFELDSQGETVALYGPDGFTLMDLVTFAKLPVGIAWGREPDGSDRWVTLNPSPGQSNKNHALPLVADTKFSVDRGFFEMPFAVTMTCATEDATIVYTTDGSLPTLSHGIEGPSPVTVTISTTTVLRAMAFKDGMRSTDVDTQTYLFLSDVIRQPAHIQGYPNPRTWLGGSAYDDHDYEMDPGIVDDADYRSDIIPSLLAIPTLSIAVEPSELADENGFYWGSGEAPCSVEL